VIDGWQTKKDVELRAADEMMIKRYAAAVASARAEGVINPLVAHAAQRLAYFTDLFGEAKMRELVTQTKDPADPPGSRHLAYTEGMFKVAASTPPAAGAR